MSALPGVRAELAAAVREVNAAYARVPEPYRPTPATWGDLEREVDAAFAARDRARAMAAIDRWRRHWIGRFTAALVQAPLDERGGDGR